MAAQQPDNRIYMVLQQWATYEEMAAVCETDKTCAEVAAEVWQSPNQQVARRSLVDFCMLASVQQVSKYVRMVNVFYTARSVDTKSEQCVMLDRHLDLQHLLSQGESLGF